MGLSSFPDKQKKTIRQLGTILDIQTTNGVVVSDTPNAICRTDAQKLCVKHGICEETARDKLESTEREARHALFYQDHQFRAAVEEHQRHARDVLCRAVNGSSKNYELMIVQERRSLQDRYEGQIEDNERRVQQLVASEAQEALR